MCTYIRIQEAQMSQRDRAMLHVIEYFALSHSRSFETTPLSRAYVSPCFIVTMFVYHTVSEKYRLGVVQGH